MGKDNQKKSFVLHDESVNTYGFRMLTSGADLEEFKKNPVMLYNHDNWDMPIGRWENIRVEGTQILADPVFDMKDPKAAEIARKVQDNFIRACSIGAWVRESSSDTSLRLEGQTEATVTRWTVREASICNIPANHNALALYDANGKRVADEDIATILELTDNTPRIENHNSNNQETENQMKEELAKMLNLSDKAEDTAIVNEVRSLRAQLDDYKKRDQDAQKAEAVSLTDAAIREGRLDASAREATLKLFNADHASAKAMLSALPKPASVNEEINKSKDKGNSKLDEWAKLSWDELDKAGHLPELKTQAPDIYEEKFKEEFGK